MFDALADPPNLFVYGLKATAALGALAGLSLLSVPAARRLVYPKISNARLRDHILFERVLEDRRTVRCTDGSLLQVIEVAGKDISALPWEVQEQLYRRRLEWIHKLGDDHQKVEIRCFSLRDRHDAAARGPAAYPSQELAEMMQAWSEGFSQAYRNRHFVMLSVRGGEESARENLRQAVEDTLDRLRDYWPAVVELGEPGAAARGDAQAAETAADGAARYAASPLNGFLGALLNPTMRLRLRPVAGHAEMEGAVGPARLPPAFNTRLADHLIASEVEFLDGGGAFQVSLAKRRLNGIAVFHGPETVWMGTLGLAGFGDKTSIDLIQHVLSLEAELAVVQHVKPWSGARAEAELRERAKRSLNGAAASMLGVSSRTFDEYRLALQLLQDQSSDRILLCQLQMTIFVFAASRDELEDKMRGVERVFQSHGMVAVRELSASEPLWFSQFPPHREWIRPALVTSANVATCVSFESASTGLTECDWGPRPVTQFGTMSGAPYNFCWHKDAGLLSPGHTALFGGTGSGKTTLLNFLFGASLGYEGAYAFLVDRSDGSYVSTKAFGGSYQHLQSDSKELEDWAELAQLNPLQMDLDRGEAMGGPTRWLTQWIRDFLCGGLGDDPDSEEAIGRIVRDLAKLPREKRNLDEVYRALNDGLKAKRALRRWVEGEYRQVYCGPPGRPNTDSLDFSKSRLFAFAFDRVLNDAVLARSLLPYLAYRIVADMERRGAPWLLGLDEIAALLPEEKFRAWYFELLQEARKKRGVVVSAFQRVGTLLDPAYPGLAELVMQQCPNKIVLPNTELTAQEADFLGLNGTEYDMVTKTHPMTRALDRFMLLKREGEGGILLRTDFSSLRRREINRLNYLVSGRSVADKLRVLEKDFRVRENGRAEALRRFGQMVL